MTVLAMVATTAVRSGALGGASAERQRGTSRAARSGRAAAILALFAVALGGLTAKIPGASVACTTIPFCGRNPAVDAVGAAVQMTHRTIAVLLFLHLIGVVATLRRRGAELQRSPTRSGHRTVTDAVAITGTRSIWRDLVALTKPRIISLLLVTTIAPMFVAGRPAWTLVLAVFAGGYRMAGGANAVNMYIDRDIDDRMARTRLRPIPSGRMHPRQVLAFGVLLSTAATWLLAYAANVLTAALALAGFYFYVFIYTRWLKRSTPQNIVIGGAAGAFPPLVGWAAVTNRIDLLAVYLFLIVFYWTPPHFWALALLKQKDYGRAGVPMAPLVWGETETKRQMLWYTLILLPLTLLPYVFGGLGIIYLACAAVLGGLFLIDVVRVIRADVWGKAAWRLYKFSLLYLALLFAAMVVDRVVLS